MSEIKSEKVKIEIESLTEHLDSYYEEVYGDYINKGGATFIAKIAEQEAEERAIVAFEEFLQHLGYTSDTTRELYQESEYYLNIFKHLLNDISNEQ